MKKTMLCGVLTAWLVMLGVQAKAVMWETDFAKASASASKTGAYLLLDFSGSDWCGWCMKLEKEVFSKPEFQAYAKTNLVCVLLDFPHQRFQPPKLKKQNGELAKKYGIEGFPSVLILSPEGELVGRTGYQAGGPKNYVEHLKQIINPDREKRPKKSADTKTPGAKPAAKPVAKPAAGGGQ